MLKALAIVDETYVCDEATALAAIRKYRPDVFVKGSDYRDFTKDVTGEILNEKRAVEEHGGELVFTDEPVYSSSTLINRFFQNWSDPQKTTIEKIRSLGGIGAVTHALEKVAKLRILVVGEPITDIYRFCNPEGISSKSPTISARFQYEEHYRGGSIAIANHLREFSDEVYTDEGGNNVTKIRYISSDKYQRVFEVTHIDELAWKHDQIAQSIAEFSSGIDLIMLADFGHGLFEGPVLKAIGDVKGFVALNVQTNSSNFGFNPYTKHKYFDYLCLDTREARLAEHDRHSHPLTVAHSIHDKIKRPMSLTCGENGSYLFYGANTHSSPAFTDQVVDATGAGDAYFAITSCLLKTEAHPDLICFVGNVFAGLKTKIIGNKSAVSKASLLKACEAILK